MAGRILFVDDEPGIREALPAILRKHEFEVTTAATVAEALCAITSQPFDVLISDLNIGHPGDGWLEFTFVVLRRNRTLACRSAHLWITRRVEG